MIKYNEGKGGICMEVTFFGTSAGLPTKERNTQAIALNLEPFRIVYGYLMSEKAHNIKYYIIQLS